MANKNNVGLSSRHKISYGCPSFHNRMKRVPINQTSWHLRLAREQQKNRVTGLVALSFVQRDALLSHGEHDIEMPDAPDYYPADWQDIDSNDEEALQHLPPGEEGYYHSHASKEAVFQEKSNECQPGHGDPHCCAHHVQMMIDSWRQQLPYLVDIYLKLKKDGPVNSEMATGGWETEVIGLDEYGARYFVHPNNAMHTNETLLLHG